MSNLDRMKWGTANNRPTRHAIHPNEKNRMSLCKRASLDFVDKDSVWDESHPDVCRSCVQERQKLIAAERRLESR